MAKKEKNERIDIIEIRTGLVQFCVLGQEPLICEAMSSKAKQELLLPGRKKTRSEKATSLKHHPEREFRDSVYLLPGDGPTQLAARSAWFKKAMTGAAIDMPGATKAELGRLSWVRGEYLPLYGVPKLLMSMVRSSDMNHTPDIRSRAILPEWACIVQVEFATPQLNEKAITNLMAAAGLIRGVGGWRPEKGSGTYGQFRLVNPDNADFKRIVKMQAREAQVRGLAEAVPYDLEARRLLEYFMDESSGRELVTA